MQAKEKISKDVVYIENLSGLKSTLSPIVEGDNNSLQSLKDARSSVTEAMKSYNIGRVVDDVVFTAGLTATAIPIAKAVFSTSITNSVTNSSINFAKKAAQHMTEKGRYVPISILKEAIERGTASPDPQGSNAIMYTIEIFKNNIPYQLEVLYDKVSNTIFHFKYWR